MKSLSFWARDHKFVARIIIIFCYCLLILCSIFLSELIMLPGFKWGYIMIPIAMALAGFIFYPAKKNKNKYHNFYTRQKVCDASLIIGTFLCLFLLNASPVNIRISEPVNASSIYSNSVKVLPSTQHSFKSKKRLRKTFRNYVRQLRNGDKPLSPTVQFILITLVILVAGSAMFGIMVLSCNVACSGGGFLGLLILLLGTAGITIGAAFLIRKISEGGYETKRYRENRRKKPIIPF